MTRDVEKRKQQKRQAKPFQYGNGLQGEEGRPSELQGNMENLWHSDGAKQNQREEPSQYDGRIDKLKKEGQLPGGGRSCMNRKAKENIFARAFPVGGKKKPPGNLSVSETPKYRGRVRKVL